LTIDNFFVGLRPEAPNSAAKLAAADLERHGERADTLSAILQRGGFTAEQVLGDWFPERSG